jgi:hypothetical protein
VPAFDFAAFRDALRARDAERWLGFYAEDAVWVEYRHTNPPRNPHVMRGREAIGAFVHDVAGSPLEIELHSEVVGDARAAFTCVVTFGDNRRIVENTIIDFDERGVTRQVDVEARDPQ